MTPWTSPGRPAHRRARHRARQLCRLWHRADRRREAWPPAQLVEIDPTFCDVIVRRWQDFTRQGGQAGLERRDLDAIADGSTTPKHWNADLNTDDR
ncbi:MAG TPA: hypothetical protein VHK01_08060 [Lacipirellulaceae bacterium]|nr:hypothetical protein [Lacipirellulaceae bacterium]